MNRLNAVVEVQERRTGKPDSTLERHVRSAIRGTVTDAAAVHVSVLDGEVHVFGRVPAGEVDRLMERVWSVYGVTSVTNHTWPDAPPARSRPRPARATGFIKRKHGSRTGSGQAARFLAGACASMLVAFGARRADRRGAVLALAGLLLLERAAAGILLEGPRGYTGPRSKRTGRA